MTLVAEPLAIAEGREAGEPRGRGHGHGFGFAPGVLETLGAFGDRCTVVRLASLGNERLDVPRWSTLAEAWAEPGLRTTASDASKIARERSLSGGRHRRRRSPMVTTGI